MTDSPAGDELSLNGSGPALAQVLPQMIAQALASVLQQVPVQAATRQHLCAQCVLARMTWGAANEKAVKAAIAAAAQAHGIPGDDPRAARLDPVPFLPAGLRDSMPPLQEAVTTFQGTEVCADHVPGRPGGKQLLIVNGPLSSAMLAGMR